MRKQLSASSGKRVRGRKRGSLPNGNPEWEDLEERFSNLNHEFSRLADLMPHK